MKNGERLNRLYEGMSVRERAIEATRALKQDRPPDALLYTSCPRDERGAFSELAATVAVLNDRLGQLIALLEQQTLTLLERHRALEVLRLWASTTTAVANVYVFSREPLTPRERRERLASVRAERVGVKAAAVEYAERADNGQLTRGRAHPDDEAGALKLLRGAIDRGELAVIDDTELLLGDFYDWAGWDVPLIPEFGCDVEAVPASKAADAEFTRRLWLAVASALRCSPSVFGRPIIPAMRPDWMTPADELGFAAAGRP